MNAVASDRIGNNLKKKIIENGISVHALEKKAGLKQSAVQNILYGKSKKPSLHLIQSVAQVLNCSISELLEEEIIPSPRGGSIEIKTALSENPWHVELYIDTLKIIHSLSKKKDLILDRNKFLTCAEEVYSYSLKNHKTKPDQNFADWLIDKS